MSPSAEPTSALLRRGFLGVAGLTILGIVVELGVERHWTQPGQLVAWGAVVALAAAVGLLARARSAAKVRLARTLAAAVVLSAAVGIWQHVDANYEAGPLDYQYADSWDDLSEATRWWLALTKSVGPSPPLAPGALAQAGLCVLLASLRHPALRPERVPSSPAARTEPRSPVRPSAVSRR